METKLPLKLLFLVVSFLFTVFLPLCAQVRADQQTLKFPVWVLAEPIPGVDEKIEEKNGPFSLAIQKIKESAPFILEGLVYGWSFTYTPSDSLRGVTESFVIEPVAHITMGDKRIVFSQPEVKDGKLWCWVSFERTDEMFALRHHWNSVQFPKVRGTGSGLVIDGTDGVKAAYSDAVRSGVRSYVQSIRKNKPKEIVGTVLLAEYPYVSIQGGRYVAKLNLVLHITEIVSYNAF